LKKLGATILILWVAALGLQAQQEVTFKSKIKLKDGTELQVVIVENVPGKYIRIRLPGEETATVNYDKIASIKHKDFSYAPPYGMPRGFYFEGITNLLFGRSVYDSYGYAYYNNRFGVGLGVTANYRFYPGLSLGIGVEPTMASSFLLLPLYAHIAGSFKEARLSAIYFVDAGWSLARNTSVNYEDITTAGGWFLRPGLGMRIDKFSFYLAYQVQEMTTTAENANFWWATDNKLVEERVMRNVVLGVRLAF